jgi:hypothetical protein
MLDIGAARRLLWRYQLRLGLFRSGYQGATGKAARSSTIPPLRVDTTVITHTYNKQVISTANANNVGFNGPGGVTAQPTAQEVAWSRERHTQPTALQVKHQRTASANRALLAAVNQGIPTVAATAKPGVFDGPEVVGSKAVVGTTDATLVTGSTVSDGKTLPHGQTGTVPGSGGEVGPEASQHAPKHALNGPNIPNGTFASGGAGSGAGQAAPTAPHDFVSKPLGRAGEAQGSSVTPDLAPTDAHQRSKSDRPLRPAPKTSAVLSPVIFVRSGDKPASTTSSASSTGSLDSSSEITDASGSRGGGLRFVAANREPRAND